MLESRFRWKSSAPSLYNRDAAIQYFTPLEVEEHMRLLWEKEWPVLSLIYSSQVSTCTTNRDGARGVGALLTEKEAKLAYKVFFLRVLAVEPNKFRPPARISDAMWVKVA